MRIAEDLKVASLLPSPSRHGLGNRLTKTGYDENGSDITAKPDFDHKETSRYTVNRLGNCICKIVCLSKTTHTIE